MEPTFFLGAGRGQRPKPLSGGGGEEDDDDHGGNYPIRSPLAGCDDTCIYRPLISNYMDKNFPERLKFGQVFKNFPTFYEC
jgi:hypothetical protein